MDAPIDWTATAEADLVEAAAYIARDSETYAASFVIEILEATHRLSQLPLSGRTVPELRRSDVRELIVGNYRIIYRSLRDRCIILAIIHGRRDLRHALRGRSLK